LVTKKFKHCTFEILGIIDGGLLRDSVATDDVLPENFLDGGGGYVGHGLRFNPFGVVFYCDNGEGVIPLRWCEVAHDVDAPPLQGPGWSYQL
jgi:hypothetical protein